MTPNIPTPAHDLDARVATLMDQIKLVASTQALLGGEFDHGQIVKALGIRLSALDQMLRTELQKPALHEPVSDQETIDAIRAHHLKVTTESMIDMRRTLESFLQGRAKPAQEEITDERLRLTDQLILDAAEKAGLWPNTVHHWLPAFHRYHAELDASIRASKGEKT